MLSSVAKHEEVEPVLVIPLNLITDLATKHFYLGNLLLRVEKFAQAYSHDVNPTVFTRDFERDCVADDHDFFAVIAVLNGEIIGHLLARKYENFGKLFVCVHQCQMEDPRVHVDHGFEFVVQWAREIKAEGIRALVESASRGRLFRSRAGFEDSGVMIIRRAV